MLWHFPAPDEITRAALRPLGEELVATRKAVLAEHSDLTPTGLHNVLDPSASVPPARLPRRPLPA